MTFDWRAALGTGAVQAILSAGIGVVTALERGEPGCHLCFGDPDVAVLDVSPLVIFSVSPPARGERSPQPGSLAFDGRSCGPDDAWDVAPRLLETVALSRSSGDATVPSLCVEVDPRGAVTAVRRASAGNAGAPITREVRDAVRRLRFSPALRGGRPVASAVELAMAAAPAS